MNTARVYLAGAITIENGDRLITEADFPGRQGRLAFAFLALNRHRRISRGELINVIWAGTPPAETEAALSAILSKLRGLLRRAHWSASDAAIDLHSSSIALRFPPHTWVDVEAAANALDEAEGALRTGDTAKAWGTANVAVSIARRPLLSDFDAPWIDARRTAQQKLLRRGIECLASASEAGGDLSLAVQYAADAIEIEPFRETGYQRLMRLHARMGNRAEALRAFERCRQLLREELGASPSPQTEEVFMGILQGREPTA